MKTLIFLVAAAIATAQTKPTETVLGPEDQLAIRELQVQVLELKAQLDSITKALQDADKKLRDALSGLSTKLGCARLGLSAENKLVCITAPDAKPPKAKSP